MQRLKNGSPGGFVFYNFDYVDIQIIGAKKT